MAQVVSGEVMILLDPPEQTDELLAVTWGAHALQFVEQFTDGDGIRADRNAVEDAEHGSLMAFAVVDRDPIAVVIQLPWITGSDMSIPPLWDTW